jgi:hypothetical protein
MFGLALSDRLGTSSGSTEEDPTGALLPSSKRTGEAGAMEDEMSDGTQVESETDPYLEAVSYIGGDAEGGGAMSNQSND